MNHEAKPEMKLRPREAAAMLGVPINTIYAWVARKKLPHIRLSPRLVVFDRGELETWIAERRIPAEAQRTTNCPSPQC
jgi:excisionase family DNA binding protein